MPTLRRAEQGGPKAAGRRGRSRRSAVRRDEKTSVRRGPLFADPYRGAGRDRRRTPACGQNISARGRRRRRRTPALPPAHRAGDPTAILSRRISGRSRSGVHGALSPSAAVEIDGPQPQDKQERRRTAAATGSGGQAGRQRERCPTAARAGPAATKAAAARKARTDALGADRRCEAKASRPVTRDEQGVSISVTRGASSDFQAVCSKIGSALHRVAGHGGLAMGEDQRGAGGAARAPSAISSHTDARPLPQRVVDNWRLNSSSRSVRLLPADRCAPGLGEQRVVEVIPALPTAN